ncbi:MAG: ThuA domain-containing protein [Candidatus Hydrogenedentes bacterium]|nr:ThuA domain-containing protein [Candidatus Hydrogenedentota bacterium]
MAACCAGALAAFGEEPAPTAVETKPVTAGYAGLPDGYAIVAYLDCGAEQAARAGDGLEVRQVSGAPRTFPGVNGPLGTAASDDRQVEFAIDGLKNEAEYVLGFTWWDVDGASRVESVRFGSGEPVEWTAVVPPVVAAAFDGDEPTWARVLLPLPHSVRPDGRLRVAFANEGGPNAVVNELWVLERTKAAARKRVLVVTGDDYGGHRWRETGPELAAILREDPRLEVSISESPGVLGSPLLAHYDAVVVHFKNYPERLPLGAAIGTGLERYVVSGKGLVLVHFGCGAFQEWDAFVNVAGRVWNPEKRGHDPHGAFNVSVKDAAHPVTRGMDDFAAVDEMYTCLDGAPPIHPLCSAVSTVDGKEYAVAFTVDSAKGPVFHCTLGHDVRAFQCEGTRELYRRAAAWAAGLDPDGR